MRFSITAIGALTLCGWVARAQTTNPAASPIDLPTVLRLAVPAISMFKSPVNG